MKTYFLYGLLFFSFIRYTLLLETKVYAGNNERWIIKLRTNQSNSINTLRSILKKHALSQVDFRLFKKEHLSSTYILSCANAYPLLEDNIQKLKSEDIIEYIEKDVVGTAALNIPPDDPGFLNQWYLDNTDIYRSWYSIQGNQEIIIAILDSGVKIDHPEFQGRLFQNKLENLNNYDDDGNKLIDDKYGWDFVNNDSNPIDDHGHGTAIAGIIAANANNNLGIAGINWESRILNLKVLDQNLTGFHSDWAEAIYYAVSMGANLINMSLTSSENTKTLEAAIKFAYQNGVTIVCSMGNSNTENPQYPAAYPNTIAVGSTDILNNRNSFSNFGDHIDIVAPGDVMLGLSYNSNEANRRWSGTSMACAIVTGVISLLKSMDQELTNNTLYNIITQSAQDNIGDEQDMPGWDKYYGFGLINGFEAVNSVQNELYSTSNFQIYPNPASHQKVTIQIVLNKPSYFSLSIIDELGRIILNQKEYSASREYIYSLNVDSRFSSGFYFLLLEENGNRQIEKLLIKK